MGFVIRDGCTEKDEFPGRHWIPKVGFSYRPALPERVYEFRAATTDSGKSILSRNVKLLTEHLVSWDITNEKGDVIPPSDAAVYSRIPSQVIDYMVDCVCGYGPDRASADAKN